MTDNINEVRARISAAAELFTINDQGNVSCSPADLRVLLADHARLQADAEPPHMCDLCRVRRAVRSDDEAIPFCQECWDGWKATHD